MTTRAARIFLLDDDELTVAMLARALRAEGYEVQPRTNPAGAVDAIRCFGPDLVLLDVKLPGVSGLDLLRELVEHGLGGQVVMLSADGTAESAVRAMKMGAADYLTKPFDLDEVKVVAASIVERGRLAREVEYLRRISGAELADPGLIGTSPQIGQVRVAAEKLARASVPTVLVTGESGTGKERVARYLHHLRHGAAGRLSPFIGVNCAALPESLIESELFGHEKGAFTDAHSEKKGVFELAAGGTILLDEIGEMAIELQAKLLRVLEERTVRRIGGRHDLPIDATVVATTNRDLGDAIRGGAFRIDLYFRLATFSLRIPPLRERRDDILDLARHFLASLGRKYGRPAPTRFSPEAEQLLVAYGWPGNVRELRNVVERLVVLECGSEVHPEQLPKELLFATSAEAPPGRAAASQQSEAHPGPVLPESGFSLEAMERSLIEQALARTRGNKAQAARLLGMTYDAIRYQVKLLGLERAGRAGVDEPAV